MQWAYREVLSYDVAGMIAGVVGALMSLYTFVGPFGIRESLPFGQRLAFCALWAVLCTVICYPTGMFTLYVARSLTWVQTALTAIAYVLIASLACVPAPYYLYLLFHGHPFPVTWMILPTYLGAVATLGSITALVLYVLRLKLTRNELLAEVRRHRSSPTRGQPGPPREPHAGSGPPRHTDARLDVTAAPPEDAAPDRRDLPRTAVAEEDRARTPPQPDTSFFERVPAELGHDVVYLKVAGHYLEVVTTQGTGMILHPLSDAVRQLDSRGMRVHRSYWVAHAHVRYIVRRDRHTMLQLTGGHRVPVSRTYNADVRRRIQSMPQSQRPKYRTEME